MTTTRPDVDVFVIGGGPVGLATAIAARRKGFRVALADGTGPCIDKACGEGLLPDGVAAARELGLQLPAAESFALRGIRFHGENVSVAADFPDGYGRGVRRTVLHRALAEEAGRCGVDLRWNAPVADLAGISARWIVGADGIGSRVRSDAGLNRFARENRRYGFRQHFQVTPWSDFVEIYWGDGCQAYITPVAPDEVGVAVLSRNPKLRVREALRRFPALFSKLDGAPESSAERGSLTATRRLRRVSRGSVALVGDASGSVDAITGEGLCLGFRQALAIADALANENLALYETAHRRLGKLPALMADFMLMLDRSSGLRRRAMPALAKHPDLFASLLAIHVGAARAPAFAVCCLALGWRMLTL
jgi:flavin-dependent dehydrogenase